MFKILLLFFLFSNHLFSAPHITGKRFPNQPPCFVNPKLYSEKVLKKSPALALKVIGTKKIAVIIVDFNNLTFSSGWHITANENFERFVDYYREVSYNTLNLQIEFVYRTGTSSGPLTGSEIPFRMPRPSTYYAQNTSLTLSRLVRDAINSAGGYVNSNKFDYVMVLHAGYGAESMPDPTGHIWSAYVWWVGSVYGFTDGIIVPEKEYNASALGVFCHEFGHQLGLPDLYYKDKSIVGRWCLMDNGLWCGSPSGSMPSHLSAWGKLFLGWVSPQEISTDTYSVVLKDIENHPETFKVPILESNDPQKEYFLIEYRNKTGFNSMLPYEGILIWHIDDTIALDPKRISANDINSGIPNLAVDLIEADKTPAGQNGGDVGDPFPGFYSITKFLPQDYGVYAYNGELIKLTIKNIQILDINNSTFDIIFSTFTAPSEEEPPQQPTFDYYSVTTEVFPKDAGYIILTPDLTSYKENTEVQLEAVALGSYTFLSWTGDIVSTQNPLTFLVDSNKYIIANFVLLSTGVYEVEIDTTPPAKITTLAAVLLSTGVVKLSWLSVGDDYYENEISSGKYRIRYSTFVDTEDFWEKGTWLDVYNKYEIEWTTDTKPNTLETYILPLFKDDTTYYFCLWCIDEKYNISEKSNIVYVYNPIRSTIQTSTPAATVTKYYRLIVEVLPENSGVVVLEPLKTVYEENTEVTLIAEPLEGFEFLSWQGDVMGYNPEIKIIMDKDKHIIAKFLQVTQTIEYPKRYYLLTPNKDNINEIIYFGNQVDKVYIFDVKGNLLSKITTPYWDGKIAGRVAPGVYIYKLKLTNEKVQTGIIIIIK